MVSLMIIISLIILDFYWFVCINYFRRWYSRTACKAANEKKSKEYYNWQRQKTKDAFEKRQAEEKDLSDLHKKQREDLHEQKENLIKQRLKDLKEQNRPKWASIYRLQEQDCIDLKLLLQASQENLKKLLINNDRAFSLYDARNVLSEAFETVINNKTIINDLTARHDNERKMFASYVSGKEREAYGQYNSEYLKQLEILKTRQL